MFAYLDCFSGISGDKFLGALVGAGLDPELLRRRLSAVDVGGYRIEVRDVKRAGIAGTQVEVIVEPGQPSRDWRAIRGLLDGSGLDPVVRELSLSAFATLAEAEARVHGTAVEDVHFHEVGAVDSIVDIVGAAIGVRELGIDEMWSTPVRLGSGTVMTSHGELPVPAPATALLLEGAPVYAGGVAGELTTPTGATLLRTFVTRYAPMPAVRLRGEGWGAGSKEFAIPNLLRLTLGDAEPAPEHLEEVAVLETAIDHATPEVVASTIALLLEDGALDAWTEPLRMKKGRLGTAVTVIVRPADAARLTDALERHTGSLGVRRTHSWRHTVTRRVEEVETSLGAVRVKVQGEGDALRVRPESDDVVRIARASGLPVERVARVLAEEAASALGLPPA